MKCAVYIRVSTDKEEQKTSLVTQKQLFMKYVSDKGWDVYEFYEDVESGTTSKRPELQRLIGDAKAKKFDVILAKELSRLARNGELSYQIKNIAEQNRVHIITLDNAINTLEGNSHMFGLYAWVYEQEAQNTSNRVKDYRRTAAQNGIFKGSIPPLGYEMNEGKLYVRKDMTPDIVRRIFRDYLSGKGFDYIARDLYVEKIPTPSQIAGKKNASHTWRGSTVRRILENPHYTGDLVQGRSTTKSVTSKIRDYSDPEKYIIVPDTHEAIISKKDFETVQQLIASRRKKRPYQEKHLFTNTAFCADCGSGMHYRKNSKGYMCGSYVKYGLKKCNDHLIREADLCLAILSDIRSMVSTLNNDFIISELELKLKKQKQQDEKCIKAFDMDIEKLKKRKKRALDAYYDGETSKEEYGDYVDSINQEMHELLLRKQQFESSLQQQDDTLAFTELRSSLEEFINLKNLTPDILHRIIERIEIKADGSPRIFYRFSNPSAYSLILSIDTQHSTCVVCGNISTG
ncbi:recombinase family protein [Bacillus sp. S13(2024)]|uniref:recombinase family protein n=1 Tax=unclassified Bacillus (in: firmicutes) TaxID=185979 RepID=UPI003D1E2655